MLVMSIAAAVPGFAGGMNIVRFGIGPRMNWVRFGEKHRRMSRALRASRSMKDPRARTGRR